MIQQEQETVLCVQEGFSSEIRISRAFLSDSVLLEASPGTCCFSDQMEEEMRGGPVSPGGMCPAYMRNHYFV